PSRAPVPGARTQSPAGETTGAVSSRGDPTAGTALDPLNNRSFDLNSSQTVPRGPLPGGQPANSSQRQGFAPVPPSADMQRRGGGDASQGTRIDPLNNRSFDLNSSKSVPALR
ncbi:MAG TPA: hypothetical protein PLQ11_07600, partial [Beijerinckiaceae bacterium]|nr:hypothetical protein [Beijerinckiaceae bacterium]